MTPSIFINGLCSLGSGLRHKSALPLSRSRPHLVGVTLALFLSIIGVSAEDRVSTPASPASEVPKGEVAKYTFGESKIFPGTVRDYWVYIPRQYDPAQPACVHVNQDGLQFKAPEVFDRLIQAKAMPVIVGVFVTPGRVKAASSNALDRFNRSYEYDGLDDDYVRFVLDELLPDVEKKTASDGRPIRLSRQGNDRSIGGSSSGAICAFTAAWERPDARPPDMVFWHCVV